MRHLGNFSKGLGRAAKVARPLSAVGKVALGPYVSAAFRAPAAGLALGEGARYLVGPKGRKVADSIGRKIKKNIKSAFGGTGKKRGGQPGNKNAAKR